MQIEQMDLGAARVAAIDDNRIDASNAEEFDAAVGAIIDAGVTTLILDLSKVEFMDSRGLGACIALFKRVEKAGALALCGLHPNVLGLFRLTRLDRVFRIFPDAEAAATAPLTPVQPRP